MVTHNHVLLFLFVVVIICTAISTVTIFTHTIVIVPTGLEASDYDGEDFSELDGVIAGCPTWNTGADEYRSGTTWDDYLDTIKESRGA